jgi:proteic killer suppression protein
MRFYPGDDAYEQALIDIYGHEGGAVARQGVCGAWPIPPAVPVINAVPPLLSSNRELARQCAQLEARLNKRLGDHDQAIVAILSAIRQLWAPLLRRFYESGRQAGIRPHHVKRLRMQLVALDTAQVIDDINIAGFRLHPLKGEEKGRWSIWVNGNWRLTFEFRDGHAYVLDYEDYH